MGDPRVTESPESDSAVTESPEGDSAIRRSRVIGYQFG